MLPTVNFLGKELGMYPIMATIGLFATAIYCIRMGKKENIDDNDFISIFIRMGIGIFIGGHLLYALTNYKLFIIFFNSLEKVTSFKILINCLQKLFGGSVFYGGLIGGLIAVLIYTKKHKMNIKRIFDILAPGIPLFHFFGRIGCFLGGCCYGIPSKFGFIYTHSLVEEANHIRRFPIQLIEALFCLGLFFFLDYLLKNKKWRNKLIYIYFIVYPCGRFILEFFRGDSIRGIWFGLSTSQIISICLIIYGIIRLITKKEEKKNGKIL